MWVLLFFFKFFGSAKLHLASGRIHMWFLLSLELFSCPICMASFILILQVWAMYHHFWKAIIWLLHPSPSSSYSFSLYIVSSLSVTIDNCGFIQSLSFPYPLLLGIEDSIGTGAHNRCLIKLWWQNEWSWYQGWNRTLDLQNPTVVVLWTLHTSPT